MHNAGRSQMAAAFAERERTDRDLTEMVSITTGGTQPAAAVHDVVIDAMQERDFDLTDRTPTEITPNEIIACDLVVTMGCTAESVCPATWGGTTHDWPLDDPKGRSIEEVRTIRDDIENRVETLFDEIESQISKRTPS